MPTADVRIDGATIIDGTGAAGRSGSVVIDDGQIVSVEEGAAAHRVIDADGMVIAPGFIDLHTHTDFTLPLHPEARAVIHQGVTTVVTGNCGFSPFPAPPDRLDELRSLTAFLDHGIDWDRCRTAPEFVAYLEESSPACNVALQIGLGTVRLAAMGFDRRPPSTDEMGRMKQAVEEAFETGVHGVSSGLVYAPGGYAGQQEVVELVSIAAGRGGFYSTHVRNEGRHLGAAISEALATAAEAGVALQLSHHKAIGPAAWGTVNDSLTAIHQAITAGRDVLVDVYPYRAGSTGFTQILPAWVLDQGIGGMRRALQDPVQRERIAREMMAADAAREFDPASILLAEIPPGPNRTHEGKYLAEVAAAVGGDPLDVAFDLLVEEAAGITMVVFGMSEDDVRRVLTDPAALVASDGWTLDPSEGGTPHPRSYGTFPRVLGRYVRDEGVLSLEEAVHKMTGLPARRLGEPSRGTIALGSEADLVVFDPLTIADAATFTNPHRYPTGIQHVLIGGTAVIDDGVETGARPGSVLTRQRGTDPVE